jgi:hypothetical protein
MAGQVPKMRSRKVAFICFSRLSLLIVLLCAMRAGAQSNPREAGSPKALILSYKCQPSQRTVLREYMDVSGIGQFEHWKKLGLLNSYRVLFGRYVDNDNWDMMVILIFPDETALVKWRAIEKESPAGLSPKILSAITAISSTPSDLMRNNARSNADRDSVFLVIPYDYTVSTAEYVRYLDGYVVPQLEGWFKEKILTHYEVFIARYGASRPWSAMLLLQYVNEEALGRRDLVVAKVREKLKDDPSWKAFAENKQSVRVEKQAVVCDELQAAQ